MAGLADGPEADLLVKGMRAGIGRVGVDLADDAVVPGGAGEVGEVDVERPAEAASARLAADDDAVDIDKPPAARLKPAEIGAVIVAILIERDQERISRGYGAGIDASVEKIRQGVRRQRRRFLGALIVERKQRRKQGRCDLDDGHRTRCIARDVVRRKARARPPEEESVRR